MDTLSPIEHYKQEKQKLNEQLKTFGRDLFKPFFAQLFVKYPTVQVVRWHQYTPYFNDGAPCTFSSSDVSVSATPLAEMKDPTDYDTDEWAESWDKTDLAPAAKEVGTFFQDIDDVLERAFGDGVQVFVERSGDITIEDYSHD